VNRRVTICLAVVALMAVAWAGWAEQTWPKVAPDNAVGPDQPFTFAVCGDNRPSGADQPMPPVYLQILQAINDTDAQLVINTGDIILGSTDLDLMNRELDDFVAATDELKAPCYVAYGNHELRSAECLQVLERRIGPSYFAFSWGNCRFYVLNTYVPGESGQITGEQLAWFRSDLADQGAKAAHRFVFLHAPLFSPMNDIGKRHWGDPANLQELQELLAHSHVDVVFSGHDHYFAWRMVDGVQHIVTGGAGAPPYQAPGALSIHHFMLVQVNGERLSIKLVPMETPQVAAGQDEDENEGGAVVLARGSKGWRVTEAYPTEPPPDRDGKKWYEPGYDAGDWQEAALPLGYKRGADVQFATEVADNGGDYYVAGDFTAPAGTETKPLLLRLNSDNGAVVYINGKLVDEDPAALNPPGHNPAYWNRTVGIAPGVVRAGQNHIAIRLANNKGSSDAFLDLEIAEK